MGCNTTLNKRFINAQVFVEKLRSDESLRESLSVKNNRELFKKKIRNGFTDGGLPVIAKPTPGIPHNADYYCNLVDIAMSESFEEELKDIIERSEAEASLFSGIDSHTSIQYADAINANDQVKFGIRSKMKNIISEEIKHNFEDQTKRDPDYSFSESMAIHHATYAFSAINLLGQMTEATHLMYNRFNSDTITNEERFEIAQEVLASDEYVNALRAFDPDHIDKIKDINSRIEITLGLCFDSAVKYSECSFIDIEQKDRGYSDYKISLTSNVHAHSFESNPNSDDVLSQINDITKFYINSMEYNSYVISDVSDEHTTQLKSTRIGIKQTCNTSMFINAWVSLREMLDTTKDNPMFDELRSMMHKAQFNPSKYIADILDVMFATGPSGRYTVDAMTIQKSLKNQVDHIGIFEALHKNMESFMNQRFFDGKNSYNFSVWEDICRMLINSDHMEYISIDTDTTSSRSQLFRYTQDGADGTYQMNQKIVNSLGAISSVDELMSIAGLNDDLRGYNIEIKEGSVKISPKQGKTWEYTFTPGKNKQGTCQVKIFTNQLQGLDYDYNGGVMTLDNVRDLSKAKTSTEGSTPYDLFNKRKFRTEIDFADGTHISSTVGHEIDYALSRLSSVIFGIDYDTFGSSENPSGLGGIVNTNGGSYMSMYEMALQSLYIYAMDDKTSDISSQVYKIKQLVGDGYTKNSSSKSFMRINAIPSGESNYTNKAICDIMWASMNRYEYGAKAYVRTLDNKKLQETKQHSVASSLSDHIENNVKGSTNNPSSNITFHTAGVYVKSGRYGDMKANGKVKSIAKANLSEMYSLFQLRSILEQRVGRIVKKGESYGYFMPLSFSDKPEIPLEEYSLNAVDKLISAVDKNYDSISRVISSLTKDSVTSDDINKAEELFRNVMLARSDNNNLSDLRDANCNLVRRSECLEMLRHLDSLLYYLKQDKNINDDFNLLRSYHANKSIGPDMKSGELYDLVKQYNEDVSGLKKYTRLYNEVIVNSNDPSLRTQAENALKAFCKSYGPASTFIANTEEEITGNKRHIQLSDGTFAILPSDIEVSTSNRTVRIVKDVHIGDGAKYRVQYLNMLRKGVQGIKDFSRDCDMLGLHNLLVDDVRLNYLSLGGIENEKNYDKDNDYYRNKNGLYETFKNKKGWMSGGDVILGKLHLFTSDNYIRTVDITGRNDLIYVRPKEYDEEGNRSEAYEQFMKIMDGSDPSVKSKFSISIDEDTRRTIMKYNGINVQCDVIPYGSDFNMNEYSAFYSIQNNVDLLANNYRITLNPVIKAVNAENAYLSNGYRLTAVGDLFQYGKNIKPSKVPIFGNSSPDNIFFIMEANQANETKRNTSIAAPSRKFTGGMKYGIPMQEGRPVINMACIPDDVANILLHSGLNCTIKTANGIVVVNPLAGIMLGQSTTSDNNENTMVKPYLTYYDPNTATSGVNKCANKSTNNEEMANSAEYYSLFRKMADKRFDDHLLDLYSRGKITKATYDRYAHNIDLSNYIKQYKGVRMFEADGDMNPYTIVDCQKIEGSDNMYTVKWRMRGESLDEIQNSDGSVFSAVMEETVTIDSPFALWHALGGINSYGKNAAGRIVRDDSSLYATVSVLSEYQSSDFEGIDLLKGCMVHIASTLEAVKFGQFNINSKELYERNNDDEMIDTFSRFVREVRDFAMDRFDTLFEQQKTLSVDDPNFRDVDTEFRQIRDFMDKYQIKNLDAYRSPSSFNAMVNDLLGMFGNNQQVVDLVRYYHNRLGRYTDNYLLSYDTVNADNYGVQGEHTHIVDIDETDVAVMTQIIYVSGGPGRLGQLSEELRTMLGNMTAKITDRYFEIISSSTTPTELKENLKSTLIKDIYEYIRSHNDADMTNVQRLIVSRLNNRMELLNSEISFESDTEFHNMIKEYASALNNWAIKIRLTGAMSVLCPSEYHVKIHAGKIRGKYGYSHDDIKANLQKKLDDCIANPNDNSSSVIRNARALYIGETYHVCKNGQQLISEDGQPVTVKVSDITAYDDIVSKYSSDGIYFVEDIVNGRELRQEQYMFTSQDKRSSYSLNDIQSFRMIISNCNDDALIKEDTMKVGDKEVPNIQAHQDRVNNIVSYLLNRLDIEIDTNKVVYSDNGYLSYDSSIYLRKCLQRAVNNDIRAIGNAGADIELYIDGKVSKVKVSGEYDFTECECVMPFAYKKIMNSIDENGKVVLPSIVKLLPEQVTEKKGNTNLLDLKYYDFSCSSSKGKKFVIMSRETFNNHPNKDMLKESANVYKNGDLSTNITISGYDQRNHRNVTIPVYIVDDITDIDSMDIINFEFSGANEAQLSQFESIVGTQLREKQSYFENSVKACREELRHIFCSRTPAQSKQSGMCMKVADYLDSKYNNVYVSKMQLLLHGSDFDIDKITQVLFKTDSKYGILRHWSPAAKLNTKENIEASSHLPMVKGIDESVITSKSINDIKASDYINNLYVNTISKGKSVRKKLVTIIDESISQLSKNNAKDYSVNNKYTPVIIKDVLSKLDENDSRRTLAALSLVNSTDVAKTKTYARTSSRRTNNDDVSYLEDVAKFKSLFDGEIDEKIIYKLKTPEQIMLLTKILNRLETSDGKAPYLDKSIQEQKPLAELAAKMYHEYHQKKNQNDNGYENYVLYGIRKIFSSVDSYEEVHNPVDAAYVLKYYSKKGLEKRKHGGSFSPVINAAASKTNNTQVGADAIGKTATGNKAINTIRNVYVQTAKTGTLKEIHSMLFAYKNGRSGEQNYVSFNVDGKEIRSYTSIGNPIVYLDDQFIIDQIKMNYKFPTSGQNIRKLVEDSYKFLKSRNGESATIMEVISIIKSKLHPDDAEFFTDLFMNDGGILDKALEAKFKGDKSIVENSKASYISDIKEALWNNRHWDSVESFNLISEFISAAVDNAKEDVLGNLNAGDNMISLYIAGLSIELDMDSLFKIMTSDIAIELSNISLGNAFEKEKDAPIYSILTNINPNKPSNIVRSARREILRAMQEFDKNAKVPEKYRVSPELYEKAINASGDSKLTSDEFERIRTRYNMIISPDNTDYNKFIKVLSEQKLTDAKGHQKDNRNVLDAIQKIDKIRKMKVMVMKDPANYQNLLNLAIISNEMLGVSMLLNNRKVTVVTKDNMAYFYRNNNIIKNKLQTSHRGKANDINGRIVSRNQEMFNRNSPFYANYNDELKTYGTNYNNLQSDPNAEVKSEFLDLGEIDFKMLAVDSAYMDDMIDIMGDVSHFFNPLFFLKKSPEYNAAFKAQCLTAIIPSVTTKRYDHIRKLNSIARNSIRLKNSDATAVSNMYLEATTIDEYCNGMGYFTIPAGTTIIIPSLNGNPVSYTLNNDMPIMLGTDMGRYIFKQYMDNYVFRRMYNKGTLDYVKADSSGVPVIESKTTGFKKYIQPKVGRSMLYSTNFEKWQLSFNVTSSENESSKALVDSFNEIANYRLPIKNQNKYITFEEAVTLYNMTVNLDRFGDDTFTKLLDSANGKNHILNSYNRFQNDFDAYEFIKKHDSDFTQFKMLCSPIVRNTNSAKSMRYRQFWLQTGRMSDAILYQVSPDVKFNFNKQNGEYSDYVENPESYSLDGYSDIQEDFGNEDGSYGTFEYEHISDPNDASWDDGNVDIDNDEYSKPKKQDEVLDSRDFIDMSESIKTINSNIVRYGVTSIIPLRPNNMTGITGFYDSISNIRLNTKGGKVAGVEFDMHDLYNDVPVGTNVSAEIKEGEDGKYYFETQVREEEPDGTYKKNTRGEYVYKSKRITFDTVGRGEIVSNIDNLNAVVLDGMFSEIDCKLKGVCK